jgi:TRAP-type C4-dicarboxylate transport system permease small subunit
VLDRILDRLEEWIIVTLIGAATALTFVAVVHRYGASNSANVARWAGVHHLLLLKAAANALYTWLASINLSWAQELATYMFIYRTLEKHEEVLLLQGFTPRCVCPRGTNRHRTWRQLWRMA